MGHVIWDGKPWQAFKTFAIIFSFIMNFVLLIVLLLILPQILPLLHNVATPLVGGLSSSFVDMSNATIERTIQVEDEIPISLNVPLDTETTVRVTQSVPLQGVPARFLLPGGGGEINGLVFLDLPAGLELPVALNLEVPIEEQIPVSLAVDVAIPLEETSLGPPFVQLQTLFQPLDVFLRQLPASNEEALDRAFGREPTPTPETGVTAAATAD